MRLRTVACVVGTRPEAIKMAPVIMALRRAAWAHVLVVASGQHDEMALTALAAFGITPDVVLSTMRDGQSLSALTARLVAGLDDVFALHRPDIVLAQGDTTTVMAAALAAFYRATPFAHVEAGLRTDDVSLPFPEEFNRRMATLAAARHYAPTEAAGQNLLREHVDPTAIVVTGNTGIDALHWMRARISKPESTDHRRILLTAHRRENLGAPLAGIYGAVVRIADAFEDVEVIAPVHPNPKVRETAADTLGGHPRIRIVPHADYPEMVRLLASAFLVLTDSGGLQEEAPALGKPVLVLRDVTERPEAVAAGVARCVGTDPSAIFREASRLLSDDAAYAAMARAVSPYGDGHASERIVASLATMLAKGSTATRVSEVPLPKAALSVRRQRRRLRSHRGEVSPDAVDVGAVGPQD